MDVVRRNITALRGTIEIESTEGVGTTMRIRLPLTLAIIDGFLVGVGGSSFVLPLEMVVECVELSEADINAAQGRDHLNLRGEVLPFIRLKELFDIQDLQTAAPDGAANVFGDGAVVPGASLAAAPPSAARAEPPSVDAELAFLLQPVQRENIVVVNYAGHRAGLVVDTLMGEYQTVIRPLGVVFNGIQGISGFTILGSGQVALILDVPGLVRRVSGREGRRNTRASTYALAE
jgi:two-component system chemotaxis sensor kinase CheA